MKEQVNSKFLILFIMICGIFLFQSSGFCANDDIITNKSSTFSTKMANDDPMLYSEDSDSELAKQIRAQRDAIERRDTQYGINTDLQRGTTRNNCDVDLRNCMESKCGNTYAKCATDSEIIFSDKLNACKKNTNCTAHEFNVFVNEIKEDKAQAIKLYAYNQTINCGNEYKDCIINECGRKFDKCLGKPNGDKALSKCKDIATKCNEYDSGLVGRIGKVFGIVRQDAEKQIKADEKKLYSLRDQMQASCESLGATFDLRSFDCVFSVLFKSGSDDSEKITASKKLYAGSLFDCTPDWFGIDVTTFKENAYRATRAQHAATGAVAGAGAGIAVGSIASGALDRAIDSQRKEKALKESCQQNRQVFKDGKCVDDPKATGSATTGTQTGQGRQNNATGDNQPNQNSDDNNNTPSSDGDEDSKNVGNPRSNDNSDTLKNLSNPSNETPKQEYNVDTSKRDEEIKQELKTKTASTDCTTSGGKWEKGKCECPNGTINQNNYCTYRNKKTQTEKENCVTNNDIWNYETKKCEKSIEHNGCDNSGGTWKDGKCYCYIDYADFDRTTNRCECTTGYTRYLSRCVTNEMYTKIQECEEQPGKMWDVKTDTCTNGPEIKTGPDAIKALKTGGSLFKTK